MAKSLQNSLLKMHRKMRFALLHILFKKKLSFPPLYNKKEYFFEQTDNIIQSLITLTKLS